MDSIIKKTFPDTCRIQIINGTFLGNQHRNFYGNNAPSKLHVKWKVFLGNGQTRVGSKFFTWAGAGWTGQPLLVLEDSFLFLIQGAYDHHLRKINAITGKVVWKYGFDDVIKSTGSIWVNHHSENYENKYVILQGSRMGVNRSFTDAVIPSYRAVSLISGKELWRLNSVLTDCYSRDVDGSALLINDTAYLCLENGFFTVFNPDFTKAETKNNILQPQIFNEILLYNSDDKKVHGSDLVTESSPAKLGNRIYICSGSGHIYGYNLTTSKIDWNFFTGADMDGSPVVTNDSCILISIEKQYIAGRGGVLKLNPSKPASESVEWFFPTENKRYAEWLGGVIGSVSVNDYYNKNDSFPHLAAFIGIDGLLYVVNHSKKSVKEKVIGFDNKSYFDSPEIIFKYRVGPSITTPVFAGNRLVACGYNGIYIFEFNKNGDFVLLDYKQTSSIEATPFVYDFNIFIACRDGFLYCFGDDSLRRGKPDYVVEKLRRNNSEKRNVEPIKVEEFQNISSNNYYLIAGSFSVKSNADKLIKKLKMEGYTSQYLSPDKIRNLVSIGSFDTKEKAIQKQSELKEKGIETWVFHR